MYSWDVRTIDHIGQAFLVINKERQICWLGFGGEELLVEAKRDLGSKDFEQQNLLEVFSKISTNQWQNTFPLHLVKGTAFQRKVWKKLLSIPKGQTLCYQDIAKAIGLPKAVRAVGNAVGANPISFLIPCHRVLRKGGNQINYRWGVDKKKMLLAKERL